MTSQFTSLPVELILGIINMVSPLDIIRLRQTCKQLYDLTLEPSIWTSYYRNSSLFLPPGPRPFQTIHDTERILVRAQKLDLHWTSESGSQPPQFRAMRELNYEESISRIYLFRGRYLLVGFRLRFVLYDVESSSWNEPIHTEDAEPSTIFNYQKDASMDDDSMYVGILVMGVSVGPAQNLTIWEVKHSDSITVSKVVILQIPTSPTGDFVISNGFLIHWRAGREGGGSFLYHIETQKMYRFPVSSEDRDWDPDYMIALPHRVIVVQWQDPSMTFDSFIIQDEAEPSLKLTHHGICDFCIDDPKVLTFASTSSNAGHLSLVASRSLPGPWNVALGLLEVTLCSDGTVTFNVAAEGTPNCNQSLSSTIHADICHRQRRIRALSFEGSLSDQPSYFHFYDIDLGVNAGSQKPSIQERQVQVQLVHPYSEAEEVRIDAFTGRICLDLWDKVAIVDLV
ncbi:hypothetical protein K435DRAFT_849292 [Dendrothele bispora CBS 962.96]|uniref:F-box domain-containing protein n=1 Tax=Dendrothele bispora (strain CBS 962.96) TaxID=1314807 RepID=A0A4S8MSR1_DENBC|nr:hypothetical protein K435DRAFT_849292 [Dendrothele bispora CBS 962.96]